MTNHYVYAGRIPDDAPKGSFSTIQSAIDSAKTGDTIYVTAGTYTENLVIRDGVSIVAVDGPKATHIHAADMSLDTVRISGADDVTLAGFTITGVTDGTRQNIHIHGANGGTDFATNVSIIGNIIERGEGDGIKLSKVSDITIDGNLITGGGLRESGVDLVGGERIVVTGNTFLDMGYVGISMKGGSRDLLVEGNTMVNIGHIGIEIGGYTQLKNYIPGFLGGNTYEAANVMIRDNTIENAGNSAFRVIGGQGVAFVGNTATGGNAVVKLDDSSLYHDTWFTTDIAFVDNSFDKSSWLKDRTDHAHVTDDADAVFDTWFDVVATAEEIAIPQPSIGISDMPEGTTLIEGTVDSDDISGSQRAEMIATDNGDDRVTAGKGADIIVGGDDRDRLKGNQGADTIYGGDGRDRLEGGDGNDSLFGGDGRDRLQGGKGDDYLDGGAGRDRLEGGDGDDMLLTGSGRGEAEGGAGADIFVFRLEDSDAEVRIRDFDKTEGDQIAFLNFGDALSSFADLDSNGNGRLDNRDYGISQQGDRLTIELEKVLGIDAPEIEIDFDGGHLTATEFLFA